MNILAQVPSAEELEQALNTDQMTAWDFVAAAAAIIAALLLAKLVRKGLRRILLRFPQISEEARLIIVRAAGWIVILIGTIYAVILLGIDVGPALFVMLVILLVLFFAGRTAMDNFAAGVVLQGSPMFAPGDQIICSAGTGTVVEIMTRTVVIETVEGETIHIPNRFVLSDPVTNLTEKGVRRDTLEVGVAYGTDLDLAKRVIEETARACELVKEEPAPTALAVEFGDSSINFHLLFWHAPTIDDRRRTRDALVRAIRRAFAENRIEIPFPQRTLWWGDGGSGEGSPEQ